MKTMATRWLVFAALTGAQLGAATSCTEGPRYDLSRQNVLYCLNKIFLICAYYASSVCIEYQRTVILKAYRRLIF